MRGGRSITGARAGARAASLSSTATIASLRGLCGGLVIIRVGGIAREIVERLRGQLRTNDTEARIGGGRSGILESVPPDVGNTEHGATDILPEGPRVLGGGNSVAEGLAADGPAGLGNPDLPATSNSANLIPSSLEEVGTLLDWVVLGILEIGVGIHAKEVAGLGEGVVGSVGVGSPGVDMTNGNTAQAGAFNGLADLTNVSNECVRVGARVLSGLDTSGRDTI